MITLSIAFKEWASVCHALASGTQSLILRKGGIAETDGEFRPEHESFLLYPTYFHEQQQKGLKLSATSFLAAAEAERPPNGVVRLSHFVRVERGFRSELLELLHSLERFHIWAPETVTQRFHYRAPGLYVLLVRTFALPQPIEIAEDPSYAGCKTWVPLTQPIGFENAKPVVDDRTFQEIADAVTAAMSASN